MERFKTELFTELVDKKIDSILNVSKALKCKTCGKYIVDEDELHKYDTCSSKCSQVQYRILKKRSGK